MTSPIKYDIAKGGTAENSRFSVIITCCNQQRFVEDAIQSVLSQTHPSKEIIVVDDGSQDGSVEILKQYRPSITLLTLAANRGASEARNRGASVASGEYLIFLDGDDLFTPWALDTYEWLISARQPATILSEARWFQGDVPSLGVKDAPRKLEFIQYKTLMAKDRQHGIYTGAFVIDRRAFYNAGGWTPEIFHLDDQDLYAKLGYAGKAIVVCSPYTMLYRMHASNSIRSVPPFLCAARLIVQRERAGLYPGGRRKLFQRYARHGGTVAFCVRKGWRANLRKDAFGLALRGWPMILAGIIREAIFVLAGRQSVETWDFNSLASRSPSGGSRTSEN